MVAGTEDKNANNIIFTIKHTKLYDPVITLSAKDNQILSKYLSKRFERSVYCNKYKTKTETKNAANEYRHFLEPNFDRQRVPNFRETGNLKHLYRNGKVYFAHNSAYSDRKYLDERTISDKTLKGRSYEIDRK